MLAGLGALQAAVFDGSINQLLFPVDPASHAIAIIATMGRTSLSPRRKPETTSAITVPGG